MPEREYIYQFKLDAAQAKREAAQITRIFNTALRDIELKPKINVANLNNIGQQIQQTVQNQMNQAQTRATGGGGSARAVDPYKAQLETAKLIREEIRDRQREEKNNLAIMDQQTSELRLQEALMSRRELSLRRQARDARAVQLGMNPSVLGGIRGAASPMAVPRGGSFGAGGELIPGFGQLQNMAGYTVAGVAIAELGRRAVETTLALTDQGTQLRRADFSARQLAGSTERLNELMRTYQRVTGGAQTTGEATAGLSGLIALGNADSQAELNRFLTASLGSSRGTGRGMDYVMQELQLTIANRSERRLDQLGLSIAEVREQEKALQGVNEEARFGEAVLTALVNKYGELVTSAEAGASGLELLRAQLREYREEVARNVEQGLNPLFESQAVQMGSQNVPAQVRTLGRMAELNSGGVVNFLSRGEGERQAEVFRRTASLLEEVDKAARNGAQGMEPLLERVQALATELATSGAATAENAAQLEELDRQYRLTADGGIVYADSMSEADRAASRLAQSQANLNSQFAIAQSLLRTSYNGQMWVNLPQTGWRPEQGPQLPSQDYLRQQSIIQGGGFLTPGGNSVADFMGVAREQGLQRQQQAYEESLRDQEQAQKEAIGSNERAWKDSAKQVADAFSDAADDLKDKISRIPGIMGTSEVTAEQLKMAEYGVPQNFADDARRRLNDEILNKVDYPDIDPAALFARAGIDPSLDPRAQLALFNQKWADSSLFADPANLGLFNRDAIAAEFERMRQSELGQQNILGAFGLGEDGQGTYFKDLGSIMGSGMKAGAEEGLAEFGRDAIGNVMVQLKSDAALAEYANTGAVIGDALFGGILDSATGSGLVSAITAEVLSQITEYLSPPGS